MSRVAVPVNSITQAGGSEPAATNGDPVNNHEVDNGGRMFLEVRNASTTTNRNLSIHIARQIDGQQPPPKTYVIEPGTTERIGPWPPSDYGSVIKVDADHADLKLRALRLA